MFSHSLALFSAMLHLSILVSRLRKAKRDTAYGEKPEVGEALQKVRRVGCGE